MDNHDVTRGSFQEFPPEGAPERPDKRGKTEPQGPEEKITEKTAELAQDIFEDDEDTCAPTSPKLTSLKRARGEKAGEEAGEEAVEGEEPKRKTEKVARKVLPYKSEFPNETNPLVSDVRDRGMQNSIKQAADAFLKSVTDKEIREKVVTLVAKIPADQRAVCMVDLREFLKDVKGEMFKEPIMEEIGQLTPDTLQSSLSWFKSLTSDVRSNKEMCWFLMEIPFKSKELLPLIEQLKPAIRGITDGGVLAGMLRVICEMSREKSLSPGQCEKLITDTKGFLQQVQMLGAQNCEIAGMGPIPESLAISQVVVATVRTFAHVPEEKRTLAVQVASRMLETTKELEDVDLKQELLRGLLFDPAFLSNTTLEEVDNGLLQTQRYLQDFGKETNVGDIFKAFTKVLPDQYADVVEKTNLLLKGCKLPGGQE